MPTLTRIKTSEYHDSITLMLVAKALLELPGVEDAAVAMGTPANREIIAATGLLADAAAPARPDDLVIAIRASDEASGQAALRQADELLAARAPKTAPDANLAIISVAGRYAAAEARAALQSGLHVLLFSDNVPLEDEISLKRLSVERGLLCMGAGRGDGDHQRRRARLRQRGAARTGGPGQRVGHGLAGGDVRAGAGRGRRVAGDRHGRPRYERAGRRADDARRAMGAPG